MGRISQAHYTRMKNKYRRDVAEFLAASAMQRNEVTYGELATRFGGSARGWGDVLGGIAIRCSDAKYPLLSVIVVNAETRMASVDAVLYEDLGLVGDHALRAEKAKCFEYDWSRTPLARGAA